MIERQQKLRDIAARYVHTDLKRRSAVVSGDKEAAKVLARESRETAQEALQYGFTLGEFWNAIGKEAKRNANALDAGE